MSFTKKSKKKIDKTLGSNKNYHDPLMVALVNSVHTAKADLEIFFKQIELIASGKIEQRLFKEAKKDLINEFREHPRYVFGHDELLITKELLKISANAIRRKKPLRIMRSFSTA